MSPYWAVASMAIGASWAFAAFRSHSRHEMRQQMIVANMWMVLGFALAAMTW